MEGIYSYARYQDRIYKIIEQAENNAVAVLQIIVK
jgi:hypothetical protein